MQYIQLRKELKDFRVFSLRDIRKIDANFHRRRLNEWQDKGYIKKIIKGYYTFSDLELGENILFEIANRIYNPSYISFETALSYYHLIPESVYGITSASSRRTYRFESPIASFDYRSIKPALFFGYNVISGSGHCFKIASAEKGVLDYFYINPHIKDEKDFLSLRFNKDVFVKQINRKRLYGFLKKFSQRTLTKRIKDFLSFIS